MGEHLSIPPEDLLDEVEVDILDTQVNPQSKPGTDYSLTHREQLGWRAAKAGWPVDVLALEEQKRREKLTDESSSKE